jgi:hypothetical protein
MKNIPQLESLKVDGRVVLVLVLFIVDWICGGGAVFVFLCFCGDVVVDSIMKLCKTLKIALK